MCDDEIQFLKNVWCVTEKLNGIFEVQEAAVDEATANDMTRAYARLLSAASLTESRATVSHLQFYQA